MTRGGSLSVGACGAGGPRITYLLTKKQPRIVYYRPPTPPPPPSHNHLRACAVRVPVVKLARKLACQA